MTKSVPNLLSIRFPPETDELFSSWLVRLAMAHSLKLHTFSKFIFPEKQIWNRDIDKSAGRTHVEAICGHTGLGFERVFKTTLISFEGSLYENHNANGNSSWLLPVGVHRLTRKRFGLQMCPLCLSEDKEPYFRRLWRLSWSTVCLKHEIVLLDECPGCRTPIIFHRGDMGWRNQSVSLSMAQCSVCSLCWTSRKVLNSVARADSDMIAFQQKLESALADNWCNVKEFGMVHSINFFNGLKHLLRMLSVGRRSEKFRQGVSLKTGLPLGEIHFSGERMRSFDYLPLESRYRTLRLAAWLLAGWQKRFVEIAEATGTFSSVLLPYNEPAPFWYWSPVYENLVRKTHPVSEEEIRSALCVLEKRQSFVLPMDLEKLLGRNFFDYKSDRFAISVYERMRKFNEAKEKERLHRIRTQAKDMTVDKNGYSKTKAKNLSREYRRSLSKPPGQFKKTQKKFDYLIAKYKRRERLKMAKRMEQKQNASLVGEEFNVSPGIVTKWHRRYKEGGVSNLDDRSRSARHFKHQIVFREQEDWIRTLHGEGLELSGIREGLKKRFYFEITDGGLCRALKRLKLILPCSKRNRFVKRNRKISQSKRQCPRRKIFAEQEQWILDLQGEGLNNSQIKRELKKCFDFEIGREAIKQTLTKNKR